MDARYKTEEQIKFIQMMDELIEKHGFNQSSIARLCRVSPSMVSGIVSGDRKPRLALERLEQEFHRITGKPEADRPSVMPPGDPVHDKLRQLKSNDPAAYEQAKNQIEFLHERAAPKASGKDIIEAAAKGARENPTVRYGRRKVSSAKTPERKISDSVRRQATEPPSGRQ